MYRKKKEPIVQTDTSRLTPSVSQTDPPSIPIDELFPSSDFPEGEIQQYKDEWVYLLTFNSFIMLGAYISFPFSFLVIYHSLFSQ